MYGSVNISEVGIFFFNKACHMSLYCIYLQKSIKYVSDQCCYCILETEEKVNRNSQKQF